MEIFPECCPQPHKYYFDNSYWGCEAEILLHVYIVNVPRKDCEWVSSC